MSSSRLHELIEQYWQRVDDIATGKAPSFLNITQERLLWLQIQYQLKVADTLTPGNLFRLWLITQKLYESFLSYGEALEQFVSVENQQDLEQLVTQFTPLTKLVVEYIRDNVVVIERFTWLLVIHHQQLADSIAQASPHSEQQVVQILKIMKSAIHDYDSLRALMATSQGVYEWIVPALEFLARLQYLVGPLYADLSEIINRMNQD